MSAMLEECLEAGARELGIDLGREKLLAFGDYYKILMEENEKYNLTSIRGVREVAAKHFIDSLSCAKLIDQKEARVFDIGTGAGFPGIPLKIYQPQMDILLVDSVRKKVDFIRSLIEKLSIERAEARWDRAEAMGTSGEFRERADIVVSRAVAPLNVLAELCLPLVRVGGCFLAMKGPGAEEEIAAAGKAIGLMGGVLEKLEGLMLPVIHEERNLILIRKAGPTPAGYPRRPGMPAKRPIT